MSDTEIFVASDSPISTKKQKSFQGRYYRSQSELGRTIMAPIELPSDDVSDIDNSDEDENKSLFKISKQKKITILTFCFTNFFVGVFYSILAPFFPKEAMNKGLSHSVIGMIFGCFELVTVVSSPFFGAYINQIGSKFMFTAGLFVSGVCSILFGFLDQAPDGIEFSSLCFLVRMVEAFGATAQATASFSIIAFNFPNNVVTMFGTLEMFTGVGLMVGPPIGGFLYQIGGYITPFAVLGATLVVVGIVSIFLLEEQTDVSYSKKSGSVWGLLKMPSVIFASLLLIPGSGIIGFLDTSLSLFLDTEFKLSPVYVGLVFLAPSLSYSIMSPFWGRIVDSKPFLGPFFLSIGFFLSGFSFFFIAPAPFLQFKPNIGVVVASLLVGGFGLSTISIVFQIIFQEATKAGYDDSLATNGLIAGIFNSFFSLGAFLGPVGGGALSDYLGFAQTTFIIGLINMFFAALFFGNSTLKKYLEKNKKKSDEKDGLLFYNDRSRNASINNLIDDST